MLIKDIFTAGKTIFSFELFPPKTQNGWEKLFRTIADISALRPAYVSVTYGAGGSTREHTHNLVIRLHRETNIDVIPHLTCMGHSRDEIQSILDRYAENGIQNILALRGDITKGEKNTEGNFRYAADLVAFIRSKHPQMGIGVAGFPEGHPASINRIVEIDMLKKKIDAGADYIVTQLFFDNRDYFDFVGRCNIAGITVPIIPGIMPITGRKNMMHMAELTPRTRFPAGLIRTIYRAETEDGVKRAGTHWATEQVRDLLDNGVPGIHLYTLNKSTATLQILESLGLDRFDTI